MTRQRYVMEIDLGECESEGEALGKVAMEVVVALVSTSTAANVRPASPALPVIRTCGDCAHADKDCGEWRCSLHPNYASAFRDGWERACIDRNAAPPEWCPKRGEAP